MDFYVWICWEYNRELMLGCLWTNLYCIVTGNSIK